MSNFTDDCRPTTEVFSSVYSSLTEQHCTELLQSGISEEIIKLNFSSLSEYQPHERLFFALPDSDRRNGGVVRSRFLKKYEHCYEGGWWFSGVDLVSNSLSEWGCFKPDRPRYDLSRQKKIKYETPPKTPTRVFAPQIGQETANAICDRWGVSRLSVTSCVSFWEDARANSQIPLFITEGAKKASSLVSEGCLAIGLPGVWNGAKKVGDLHQLIPELKAFAPNRQIYFAFDSDEKPETIKHVRKALNRTGWLLEREGAKVSVIQWSSKTKGVDDLLYARGSIYFQHLIDNAVSLADFKLQTLTDLNPLVNQKVNQRYLGKLEIPQTAQVIGLQSAKGTGKTESLTQIVQEANLNGTSVLVMTHRIQLARTLCERFGIDHIEEIRDSETGGILGYGLCIDSLHPFSKARIRPTDWSEAIVILDECEQVFWHLLNSSTCKDNRIKILNTLKETLQTVINTGGKIYLSDADLSPMAIQYVQALVGREVETHIVKNYYNPNQGKRKLFVVEEQKHLIDIAFTQLEANQKIYLALGAQKKSSRWSTQNLEELFRSRFPDKKILRIDGESIADHTHPAFRCVEHINDVVSQYDLVVASPTLETGLSIDVKGHFDAVLCLASGVQTVDAVVQTMERVRDDVPRFLYAPERGLSFVGAGETSPSSLLKTQEKIARVNIQRLTAADLSELDFDNLDQNFSQESLIYWARRACVVNQGMYQYKGSIIDKLIREGYTRERTINPLAYCDEIKESIGIIKEEAYEEERIETSLRPNIDERQLKKLQEKHSLSVAEKQILKKAVIEKKYGVECTPELIEKDDKGWYSQLRLHYFLTVGRAFLNHRDSKRLNQLADHPPENDQARALFTPDLNRDLITSKILALEALEINQFFGEEKTFAKSDLEEWFNKIVALRYDIKAILGVWISPESNPITAAQSLLRKLGVKLTYLGRYGSRGNRESYYSGVKRSLIDREEIFSNWLEKDQGEYEISVPCQGISV